MNRQQKTILSQGNEGNGAEALTVIIDRNCKAGRRREVVVDIHAAKVPQLLLDASPEVGRDCKKAIEFERIAVIFFQKGGSFAVLNPAIQEQSF